MVKIVKMLGKYLKCLEVWNGGFLKKHSLKVRLIRKRSNNCGNIRIRRGKRVQRKALLAKLRRNR